MGTIRYMGDSGNGNSTMKSVSWAVVALDYSLWLTSSIAILVDWFIDLVLEI